MLYDYTWDQSQLIQAYLKLCLSPSSPKQKRETLISWFNWWKLDWHGKTFSPKEKFYCYAYLDPRKPGKYSYQLPSGYKVCFTHEPFYVGKGTGGRKDWHLIDCSRSLKVNKIKAIKNAGLEPIIQVTPTVAGEAKALAFEVDLILGIGRLNLKTGPLTNATNGGIGAPGARRTRKERQAMSRRSKGRKHSEETKKKLAAKALGRKVSPEARAAMSASRKGRIKSAEHLRKISMALRARGGFSKAHRRALSESQKGKVISQTTRNKISASTRGKPKPPGFGEKIRKARIGKPLSEETKRKISAARKGKKLGPRSAETCAKIRAKVQAYWDRVKSL